MSALDFARLDGVRARYPGTALEGEDRLRDEMFRLLELFGIIEEPRHPFGEISPLPKLVYPHPNSVLLDTFRIDGYWLCSARLRSALSLPPDVVQYVPTLVDAVDPSVHTMEYQVMRVIAGQAVIDIDRSDVDLHRYRDRFIGGKIVSIKYVRRFALREGLQPRTELFHASESQLDIFATDSLAERVMQAGCLGMEFSDPEHPCFSDDPPLIRTARGVERRSPATRAAHLRLVKRVRAAGSRHGP